MIGYVCSRSGSLRVFRVMLCLWILVVVLEALTH